MSKKNQVFGDPRSLNHSGNESEPRRVASRMEGAMKNMGNRQTKKPSKSKN
ncbi:MAG: hypothetical protein KBC62_03845 [Candidatus Pacebacteria bacterium]|nr:hypothetical protein [Candidatus Paceibacterota bacterium]